MPERNVQLGLGTLALLGLAANVSWHVQHGTWFDCFWVCNAATLLAGLGLLFRSALLSTSAFVWVVPGTLAWGTEALLLGSTFAVPSYLLHFTGFAAAVYGVRSLGAHAAGYLGGLALFAALLVLSRALPVAANVNCAFGPRASWKAWAALELPHHVSIVVLVLIVVWTMNRLALAWATWARSRSQDPRS
ncbi:MAG TPA: hypothetical protein VM686_28955 [Polyangiaceae bacterium]|nr:hypothetical protein [Polyangiaceae bacterium]